MAEAEDVIVDVARHATAFAQDLWRRHRSRSDAARPPAVGLADIMERLDLLITAIFGTHYRIRMAQRPAAPTFFAMAFEHDDRPRVTSAMPATDGVSIWIPADAGLESADLTLDRLRTVALQQAMRASRGSAASIDVLPTPLERDVYLLLEAQASDVALARQLPGMVHALNTLRQIALGARPSLSAFPAARRPLERFARRLLERDCRDGASPVEPTPEASAVTARQWAKELAPRSTTGRAVRSPLYKDWWTGELRAPGRERPSSFGDEAASGRDGASKTTRSARLPRRPEVRTGEDDEDDARQGAWMIQSAQPQEHAEDPLGLQRPTDRDESAAAEDFADSVSELAEARLVTTPGLPREALLSDDPPDARANRAAEARSVRPGLLCYPEWDYRIQAYRLPGATVGISIIPQGSRSWVDRCMAEHRPILDVIRRRFEMLRAHPVRRHRQLDGDEVDLDAVVEGHADFRAGLPMPVAVYETQRRSRRDMAVVLLIDVSSSTDGWIGAKRRIIDVEREALLLVCIAMDVLGEPFAVQAFSGEGSDRVTIGTVKRFDEPYGDEVACRIAALEPERYTRTGTAIRHATATLMREPAAHRLLLLLSDGKPNDVDQYDGKYGIEDTHRSVTEARMQGLHPFCLTVDRCASEYLPAIFGAGCYAMLVHPEQLPSVLLEWMRRLVIAA